MPVEEQLPAWQQINGSVTDLQLYPYLVRLAVVANLLTKENDRRRQAAKQQALNVNAQRDMNISKLPKGTIKGLRAYFKLLALDKQGEPVNPALKRTYLAFYAQLLEIKSERSEDLEDFEKRPELLIAKFLAIVSKIAGPPEVPHQGAQFVQLLRSVAKRQGASSLLDSQLLASEGQLRQSLVDVKKPKEEIIPADADGVSTQIAAVMLVSPTLFARDLAKEARVTLGGLAATCDRLISGLHSGRHPIYQPADFPSTWAEWSQEETESLQGLRKHLPALGAGGDPLSEEQTSLIPPEPRNYFARLLRDCIEFDKSASTLFSAKTLQMIRFVARYWRIPPRVYASCLLNAINSLYSRDDIDVSTVMDAFNFIEKKGSIDDGKAWALSDELLIKSGLARTSEISLIRVEKILTQLFTPKPPKMGPHLQIVEETVPNLYNLAFSPATPATGQTLVNPAQIGHLRNCIIACAEAEYDRLASSLPRDSTLEVEHISNMVHSVIAAAEKVQKRYKMPLLGQISIAVVVCREQLKLLSSDFMPLWQHCLRQYEARNEEPPFDVMLNLHDELLLFQDLYSQLARQLPPQYSLELLPFDAEHLLFPYFERWAIESGLLAREWVGPALEHDDSQPVDRGHEMLHSSAVKDLFRSFHSFVKLVDDLHWQNTYHVARLLTIVIGGVSSALCDWASQVQTLFYQELDQSFHTRSGSISGMSNLTSTTTNSSNSQTKLLRAKEHDEEWLAYAKETTAQAKAAVLSARQRGPQPEPFEFKRESGVKINNIDAAYEMLHQMESQLNSDQVSRNMMQLQSRASKRKVSGAGSHLFTVTIISATDLGDAADGGVYVTLVDQDSRKQLGKTRTAFGSSRLAAWNEPIELEVGKQPRLLKATVWAENSQSNHELCGRVLIRLDPKDFNNREYGMQLKWFDLESGVGKLQVMIAVDALKDDIRFHFGKALRFLMRARDSMITSVVDQFSEFIFQVISKQTLKQLCGTSTLASVQTSVNQLQKSFNSWLGKSLSSSLLQSGASEPSEAATTTTAGASSNVLLIEDSLNPLYDYLNKNFGTLAGILTTRLRKEVLAKTWDVVLEALELLIIPPLHAVRKTQVPLNSTEMEVVYTWLSCLRDFFYSDGAGPSLERLQNANYQLIMAIPVYYDLPTTQLKLESEKIARSNSHAVANSNELIARQRTVMAHRNKSVIEHQTVQLHNAQRTVPRLDDVVLRILRLRNEGKFIDQHLRYRERLLQREMTERALQGSFY